MAEDLQRTDAQQPKATKANCASSRTTFDWFFRNRRTGSITVAQVPNPPMWIFLAAVLVRWTVPMDVPLSDWIEGIALVSLSWWAFSEVRWGVNPWRRLLGLGGFAIVIVRAASQF